MNWNLHLPKLLHMAVVNLDAHRMITCAHARQTLLNICLHFATKDSNLSQVANTILNNRVKAINPLKSHKYLCLAKLWLEF